MATAPANAEPSMEEILASIRRIISEDEQPARKPAPAEDPLELTQPAGQLSGLVEVDDLMVFDGDEDPVFETPPAAAAPQPPAPVKQAAPPPRPDPQPALRAAPEPSVDAGDDGDAILSDQAFASATSAFTRLAGTMRIAGPGQTLEGLVREMLRPMLKEWLDENLPPLVEAKVDAEVQRITKGLR